MSIKPGKKYFSVVYEIVDPEAFQATASFLSGQMAEETVSRGARVQACGWGDYATERDAYYQELLEQGLDTDEVVANFMETELGDEGSFPNGEGLDEVTRNVLG